MENGPIQDVFPTKHGDIPASYVSLPEGKYTRMSTGQCRDEHWPMLRLLQALTGDFYGFHVGKRWPLRNAKSCEKRMKFATTKPKCSMGLPYIYLHLPYIYGKCG